MKEKEDAKKIAEEVKEAYEALDADAPWSDVDTEIHGPESAPGDDI